jgi:hypothetical protein
MAPAAINTLDPKTSSLSPLSRTRVLSLFFTFLHPNLSKFNLILFDSMLTSQISRKKKGFGIMFGWFRKNI